MKIDFRNVRIDVFLKIYKDSGPGRIPEVRNLENPAPDGQMLVFPMLYNDLGGGALGGTAGN